MSQEAEFHHSLPPGVDSLIELARDPTEAGRALLVNAVCDLFVDGEQHYSGRETALMTDILSRLIGEIEIEVRKNLAERLSEATAAPRELIIELANDEICVARSVLQNSPVLRDPDLVEIVRHRAREHHLVIATRQEIGETVCDALVETDDVGVTTTLLENKSAAITVLTLEYLVEQSERVDAYHKPLLRREELPAELAKKMYDWVSTALREHIVSRFKIAQDELDKAIDDSVSDASTRVWDSRSGGKAGELVDQLSRSDMLTAQSLIQVLRDGEIPLFEAMLARFTGLELNQIKKVIYEADSMALAVACKASHVTKPDFASIFLLSRQARPGDKMVDPGELKNALRLFDRIDLNTAEKMLEKWRQRPDHSEAILKFQTSLNN